LQVEVFSDD